MACWQAGERVGEHNRVLACTVVRLPTQPTACIHKHMCACSDGCSHAERPAGERGRVLANTIACWGARSYDCQHSRLHAFTSACVHTATAVPMLSGETAFINGNFRGRGRVRFLLHESVTKRGSAVSCRRGP